MDDKMSFEERKRFVEEIEDEVLNCLKSKNISYGLAVTVLNDVKKYLEASAWKNRLH